METKKNILVVDDSSTSTFLLESFFEENGYNVIVADDGNKAIAKLAKMVPDVIFLDLMMPKKSGFDVLAEIKNMDEVKHVPVIIISARSEQEDIRKAKQMGAVEYLYKPIDIEYALDVLHKLNI